MFQSVKYNLLIPFQYDSEQNDKLPEDRCDMCKEKVEVCREKGMDSKIWFQKCFRMKPLENNEQKKGSPLLEDDRYKIIRMELEKKSNPKSADDDLDEKTRSLQEMLEAKFDELFGTIEDED